eukprot:SAG22_NODE_1157_length_5331_cov_1.886086_1_plen_321_part_00
MIAALGSVAGDVSRPGDISQQVPYFGTTMVHIEAENFTAAPGSAWRPAAWGGDVGLFAATVADTFHSRRAFLHAPAASAAGAVATAELSVTRAGTYSVLARYETGFRFQQPFSLKIARKSEPEARVEPLFSRMYGHREAPKVQPFGGCPDLVGQPLYAPNASCPHPGCGQLSPAGASPQRRLGQQPAAREAVLWSVAATTTEHESARRDAGGSHGIGGAGRRTTKKITKLPHSTRILRDRAGAGEISPPRVHLAMCSTGGEATLTKTGARRRATRRAKKTRAEAGEESERLRGAGARSHGGQVVGTNLNNGYSATAFVRP